MRAIGLDGRALLPLIVGFGGNVPALAPCALFPTPGSAPSAILVPYTCVPPG
jgi:ferrous iron transport protein B